MVGYDKAKVVVGLYQIYQYQVFWYFDNVLMIARLLHTSL